MNLQLARLHELTEELQLAGVETNATALAQQAASSKRRMGLFTVSRTHTAKRAEAPAST